MPALTPRFLLAAVFALATSAAHAQLSVRDDLNRPLILKKPAVRVVTLAPFLTETLFAIGAGDLAVGVDEHSDYPPAVFSVPKVPTGATFSLEKLAALKPDLVLAWRDGMRREDIERISGFGATVFVASARQLDDVPRLLRTVGLLTGRDATNAISDFETKLDRLRRDNANKLKLTTFLEIWNRPLTTISEEHFLTEALDICRAENVFAGLPGVAPKVTQEQLLEKDPFVIVGAGSASSAYEFATNWKMRPALSAVRTERLFYIDEASISRPTPRTPEGIAKLCAGFDEIRAGRSPIAHVTAGPLAAPAANAPSLGGFMPSIANPVNPSAPARPAPAAATRPVDAESLVAPPPAPIAPAKAPEPAPPPAEERPRRPSQFGL